MLHKKWMSNLENENGKQGQQKIQSGIKSKKDYLRISRSRGFEK